MACSFIIKKLFLCCTYKKKKLFLCCHILGKENDQLVLNFLFKTVKWNFSTNIVFSQNCITYFLLYSYLFKKKRIWWKNIKFWKKKKIQFFPYEFQVFENFNKYACGRWNEACHNWDFLYKLIWISFGLLFG